MRVVLLLTALALPVEAMAGTLVATRPLRAHQVIAPSDVTVIDREIPGALQAAGGAVGMETRKNIYPGRPIFDVDIGPAAVVARNQIVSMTYAKGGLTIVTDGRALDRAGQDERVRVMNLDSRAIVTARVTGPAEVVVGP